MELRADEALSGAVDLVRDVARGVMGDAKQNLSALDFDTQSLTGSGEVRDVEGGAEVSFEAGHAEWVEFGRPPGISPSVDAVTDWLMKNRGIKSRRYARNIAIKYCAKVERQGLPAQPFLRPARATGEVRLEQGAARLKGEIER